MAYILGVDTGGTFTDAVIFDDAREEVVCKSKAFTTKSNLGVGISNAISQLSFHDYSEIWRVHLSTTLTANSIQEKDFFDKSYPLSREDGGEQNVRHLNRLLRYIIENWLRAVRGALDTYQITAALYVLGSDGTLMNEGAAKASPVSVLLSGPAASVIGGFFLSKEEDFLLIDMGGTTADITKIEHGSLRFCQQTLKINDYPIRLNALDIQTFSVGGDSHIHYDQFGSLVLGPKKVIPLCTASSFFPYLCEELNHYRKPDGYELFAGYETDCYIAGGRRNTIALTDFERKVVHYLEKAPHSLFFLAEHFDVDADALHLSKLVRQGYVYRISFTPTDVLHATHVYTEYDEKISDMAIKIMASLTDISPAQFISKCEDIVTNQLIFSCMQSIANFEKQQFDFRDSKATIFLMDKFLNPRQNLCSFNFTIRKPIVAVGAPSGSWVKAVAEKLGTRLILPPNYDVANAIGAAVSQKIRRNKNGLCFRN